MKCLFATLSLLTAVLLLSCDTGTGDNIKYPKADVPAQQLTPSLALYTDTLATLGPDKPLAVARAVELFEVLAPYDSTGADSAASGLFAFIQRVVKNKTDSLYKEPTDFAPLLNPAATTLTEKQKAFKTSLYANRLKLVSDGEGGAYVVPSYETILPTIRVKTSAAVDSYLDLAAKEDTTPVLMDAGLAVEMTELVDRLVMSEQLTNQTLPKQFAAEAARLNRFYTGAVVTGSDNSPSLAYESNMLNEDFRKGYEYLQAKYPASKAAAKINVWLAVVASGDKKKIADFRRTMH